MYIIPIVIWALSTNVINCFLTGHLRGINTELGNHEANSLDFGSFWGPIFFPSNEPTARPYPTNLASIPTTYFKSLEPSSIKINNSPSHRLTNPTDSPSRMQSFKPSASHPSSSSPSTTTPSEKPTAILTPSFNPTQFPSTTAIRAWKPNILSPSNIPTNFATAQDINSGSDDLYAFNYCVSFIVDQVSNLIFSLACNSNALCYQHE